MNLETPPEGIRPPVRPWIVLTVIALLVAVAALVVAATRERTTSTAAANATTRSWTGSGSGTRRITSSTTAEFDGTLQSQPTGPGRFHSEVTLRGTAFTGSTTFTTAQGDTVRGSIAGWDTPTGSTTEIATFTFRIDAGSGRFTGASGNATYTATIVTSPGASSSAVGFTFGGLISY
ncbi:MAG TPA: hypothetical protein VL119_05480 [Acidimicrobiia bacterium]|nr:hypothetical protein [Acidimicrobiia bacterium]